MLNLCSKQYSIAVHIQYQYCKEETDQQIAAQSFQILLGQHSRTQVFSSSPPHFLHISSMVPHFWQNIFCSTGFQPLLRRIKAWDMSFLH